MRRTFVVGCPRSGTTIVQSLLARHPAVYTLPETAFFEQLYGNLSWRWGDAGVRLPRPRLRQRLGLGRRQVRELVVALHVQLTGQRFQGRLGLHEDTLGRQFLSLLDRAADDAGRSMWIEKTPNHLLYIPEIEQLQPDAKFVHVIRRGEDVLASVIDAHLRFENDAAFGGGAVLWARRWNHAVEVHRMYANHPSHHIVFLEDMVRQPDVEWARLCAFLDLPEDAVLDGANRQSVANLEHEPWKKDAIHGHVRQSDPKVDGLFGPKMQEWLAERLSSYQELRSLCRAQPTWVAPRPHLIDTASGAAAEARWASASG
ncbi:MULTISPECIES: sulfotransferase family protein [Dyella]|uniref:Sulfotransferase n=2 Tax=Dyella TaxID=231454 RepID=A0A4V2NL73_9GAMM|nr:MULTISPECIES: sulfotransferase [Dyella]TBR37236.1 sulfotransferase [Dyella terrae]TCI07674.1 sulfotransferase [Dyella soli]